MSYKKRYMKGFDPFNDEGEFRFIINAMILNKLKDQGIKLNKVINETFAALAGKQDDIGILEHLIESYELEQVRLKQEVTEHEHAVEWCKEYRKTLKHEIDRMKIKVSELSRAGEVERLLDVVSSTFMSLYLDHKLGDIEQLLIEKGVIAKLENLGHDFDFTAHLREFFRKEYKNHGRLLSKKKRCCSATAPKGSQITDHCQKTDRCWCKRSIHDITWTCGILRELWNHRYFNYE